MSKSVIAVDFGRDGWTITRYTTNVGGCWSRGCRHVITCDTSQEFWEVRHYLPGEDDEGEAYRKFNFVDYMPSQGVVSPFYNALSDWLEEIHAHMSKVGTEERHAFG